MNKSILVLDENSVIHGLIASALEMEGLTLHHEFNPGKYVERASSLMPDLILLGNSESDPDYDLCRSLKSSAALSEVPLVLLASSKEGLSRGQLERMQVDGLVRKPFEASDLQQQVSKHLDLADLIGAAYEFRQSQGTGERASNPLENLDVLDEEVLGMLRQDSAGAPATWERGTQAGEVVDDRVLAETLEPERAFERVEEPAAEEAGYDTLETLEAEYPGETPQAGPAPADESELEELGAADLLEEEAPEETVFAPQGFDQSLEEAGAGGVFAAGEAEALDRIEVELPEDALDTAALDEELGEGEVDLFESELEGGALPADGAAPTEEDEAEESIPLSVRRMMDLKPVFTLTQEEAVAGAEEDEVFAFEPLEGDVDGEEEGGQDLAFADAGELEELEAEEVDAEEMDDADFIGAPVFDALVDEHLAESGGDITDITAETAAEIELELPEEVATAEEPGEDEFSADMELEPPEDFDLEMGAPGEADAPGEMLEAEEAAPPAGEEDLESADMIDLDVEEVEAGELGDELAAEELESGLLEGETLEEATPEAEAAAMGPAGAGPGEPGATESGEDEDFFLEEYLGDEEIDEEQIIAAEMEEPAEYPELTQEDEEELKEMLGEDEDLAGLDRLETMSEELQAEVDAEDATLGEDIELEEEEEEVIRASLEEERRRTALDATEEVAGEESLFERNLHSLDEQGAAPPQDVEDEEQWALRAEGEGGFILAEEGPEGAPGQEIPDEEIITLGEPIGRDASPEELELEELEVELEAVEAGELEAEAVEAWEPEAEEEIIAAEPPEADELAAKGLVIEVMEGGAPEVEAFEMDTTLGGETASAAGGDEEEISIDFPEEGAGEADVFAAEEGGEKSWRPEAPPSFVPKPAEEFPEDAVKEPFEGPRTDGGESGPSPVPRHRPGEMLEDPESLGPVIEEGAILGGETEPAAEPELDEMVLEEAPMEEETLEESFEELAPTEEVAEVEEADGAGLDLEAEAPEEEGLEEEGDLATLLGAHAYEDVAPSAAMQAGAAATAPEGAPAWEAPEEEGSAGEPTEEEAAPAGDSGGDSEFDDLFSSLKEEIAANPEGERLEDVLRNERIRDRVAELEFALPQHESSFARALGVYALPGDGEPSSAYPAASRGNGGAAAAPPPPAAEPAPGVQPPPASPLPPAPAGMPLEALSLLDPDIRAKLGQVLDEIISMSVRKAVQEEMPKIVERMAKDR